MIFSFAVGGLAGLIYEWAFRVRHEKISSGKTKHCPNYYLYYLAPVAAPTIFIALILFTDLNPIYPTLAALILGGLSLLVCRPDLKEKMIASALIFLGFYFIFFLSIIVVYPEYVMRVWNLKALSGILIIGVPLEELIFALGSGFLWSGLYEYLTEHRIIKN